jgi:hypothetical protein
MSNIRRSERRSARHPDRIEFARDQRKQANEFARDLAINFYARKDLKSCDSMDTSVTQNLSGVRKQIEDAIDKRIEQRRPLSQRR